MSIFTKSLQNIGRVVRQMGTGGFNAVQARLSQAGLFPGGIAGLDRRGLNTNAGSPSSTGDWAVKLSLPPAHFNQLMANSPVLPDTMMADNGMRFPTTPFINLQHTANYDARAVIHNNFPYYAYQNSQVQQITISGDFPVQDQASGRRWIGTVHFLRTITKMYYGGETNKGNPPPICRLNGYGDHVFSNVPCVVTDFTVEFRQNVDYISIELNPSTDALGLTSSTSSLFTGTANPHIGNIGRGGGADSGQISATKQYNERQPLMAREASVVNKVPTDSLITITVLPVYSRNKISNQFDLKAFANGSLTKDGFI